MPETGSPWWAGGGAGISAVRQALLVLELDVDDQALESIEQPDPEAVGQAVLDLVGDFDESVLAEEARSVGLDYIRENAARAPVVALARVGRMYGVFRPVQNVREVERCPNKSVRCPSRLPSTEP